MSWRCAPGTPDLLSGEGRCEDVTAPIT